MHYLHHLIQLQQPLWVLSVTDKEIDSEADLFKTSKEWGFIPRSISIQDLQWNASRSLGPFSNLYKDFCSSSQNVLALQASSLFACPIFTEASPQSLLRAWPPSLGTGPAEHVCSKPPDSQAQFSYFSKFTLKRKEGEGRQGKATRTAASFPSSEDNNVL